ncbi:NADase-type glycan-binding domain-containing protein [Streptomyces sp. NPDC048516]|uniref:NADase-type glycan-binding domain-containing protein n=1 Tax=Streptomyces sp. NPDC048516 TaxID=3365565 RepID=UPI0037221463
MPTDHLTCPDCGAPAPQSDQSFCDSCGAFLRWDRPAHPSPAADRGRTAAAAQPAPPAPAGADVPESAPGQGATDRPARSDATPPAAGPSAPTATPAPATGHSPHPAAVPQQGTAAEPTVPLPSTSASDGGAGRSQRTPGVPDSRDGHGSQDSPPNPNSPSAPRPAGGRGISETGIRALLVPVPDASPIPSPGAPGSVLPGRPDAARPRVRTPQAAPEPEHGAPCRSCGTLNAPGRHFCRSCATLLTDTTPEAAEGPYAGERPRLHHNRARWITRAVVAVVIAAAVAGGIIGGPPAARAVQDHFAERVPVAPATWRASHSGAQHGVKLAFDGYSNTWWGTGYSGTSDGQYLEAGFGQPTDLLNIVITSGASGRTPQAADPARPREFDLIVTDSAGKQHVSQHRLNDGGAQSIDAAVRDAMTVRLVLHTAYGATDEKQVAIAEMEFFGRSAG